MEIAVQKTESKSTWFFLQPREVFPLLNELEVPALPVKTLKAEGDIFSFAASPKMTSTAPQENTDPDEEELPEYLWYDQEEAELEDIIAQWEDGSAYESPEAAEAWILEIQDLQNDIDSSPYIDDETQAAYDAQFNNIYSQPAISSKGGQIYTLNGTPMTLGDAAFGYMHGNEYVPPNPDVVYDSLQQYQTNPEYQESADAITDSLNTIQEMLIEEDPGPPLDVAVADSIDTIDDMYADLADQLNEMAEDPSKMTPGAMLSLQLQMTLISQLAETMSNILSGVNSIYSSTIRNFK